MLENEKDPDALKTQGRMAMGYGVISREAMRDRRLTVEAKAIYSYFCSGAAEDGEQILEDLQMSRERYGKHFSLLKTYGYIAQEEENKNE